MECINGEFPVRISISQGLVIIEIKVGKRYAVYAHRCIIFFYIFSIYYVIIKLQVFFKSTKKTHKHQHIKWAFKISVQTHFLLPSRGWLCFLHKQGYPERWLQQSSTVYCFNPYIHTPHCLFC